MKTKLGNKMGSQLEKKNIFYGVFGISFLCMWTWAQKKRRLEGI